MKKIALVRGPSLNKWETQNYETLINGNQIIAFASKFGAYNTADITLPIKRLWCLGETLSFIPGGIKFLYKYFGDTQCLVNLENALIGFDIAHTAELGNYYSYQAIQAKKKGLVKKVVVTVWENIPFLGNENLNRKKIKEAVVKNADLFLAVTKTAKSVLEKEGVESKKIRLLPMGIDITKFNTRNSNDSNNTKKTILFVGRLVLEKGIYVLLNALDQIKARQDWELLVVGDGPEKQNFKSQISNLKLNKRINILSNVYYDDMPQIYNTADIFVLPSYSTSVWREQFGFVLIEAMASGLPTITTDGVTVEVVGKAGRVVPEKNSNLLAKSIVDLLDSKEERKIRGKEGRALVEKYYNSRKISSDLEEIYTKLLL